MQQAGNPNIYICPLHKLKFQQLGAILEMSHGAIYVEDNHIVFKKIISAEYSFDIYLKDQVKLSSKFLNLLRKNLDITLPIINLNFMSY